MSRAKLISVRVNEEDLKVIDEHCSNISWRKRSDVINAGITLAALAIKTGLINDILRYHPPFWEFDEFTFKCHRRGDPKFG